MPSQIASQFQQIGYWSAGNDYTVSFQQVWGVCAGSEKNCDATMPRFEANDITCTYNIGKGKGWVDYRWLFPVKKVYLPAPPWGQVNPYEVARCNASINSCFWYFD